MPTATHDETALQRPTLAEVDVFGLTHPGNVRRTNADQFLVASLHRTLHIHATSLAGGGYAGIVRMHQPPTSRSSPRMTNGSGTSHMVRP